MPRFGRERDGRYVITGFCIEVSKIQFFSKEKNRKNSIYS